MGLLIQFLASGGLSKTVGIPGNDFSVARNLIDGDVVLRRWRSQQRFRNAGVKMPAPISEARSLCVWVYHLMHSIINVKEIKREFESGW